MYNTSIIQLLKLLKSTLTKLLYVITCNNIMLTKRTIQELQKLFKSICGVKCLPFTYNNTVILHLTVVSSNQLIFPYFISLLLSIRTIFLIIVYIYYNTRKTSYKFSSTDHFIYVFLPWVIWFYLNATFNHIFTLLARHEFARYINHFFQLYNQLENSKSKKQAQFLWI